VVAVVQTEAFRGWLAGLRDRRAVARIASRIALIERGSLGDVKALAQASLNSESITARDTVFMRRNAEP
jgi:putative component of toxin-antitoxin plasmid stabilization module